MPSFYERISSPFLKRKTLNMAKCVLLELHLMDKNAIVLLLFDSHIWRQTGDLQ